ncbi:mitochondrial 54S ribosomal protein YmL9 [Saccharomycopsis crataegensis]|uniref:Large ribosomal subunit protein uL3m n=1 Tax=Saccharomycopsis crataegensis TaxID=43959 RepID=A0AAV5QRG0_9ASCO|nr:mitochondrial 54S ribosomal protein YmL9 [Saccharomycopsis crataegensis]
MSLLNTILFNSRIISSYPKLVRTGASLTSLDAAVTTITSKAAPVNHSAEMARLRKRLPSRPGLVGVKKGMISYFTPSGEKFPCTVVEIDSVEVLYTKTPAKEGYYAVQLGYGAVSSKKISRAMLGHFARAEVNPKEAIYEFQVKDETGLLEIGTELKADHFKEGQYVDLKSVSKGKGFAGVMKRWHFAGLRASHGTSVAHRHGGSYGQNQTPGRVYPGRKMPGHMGHKNATIQNSEVIEVNAEKGYILIKGPISGANGTFVKIQDAIKKQ